MNSKLSNITEEVRDSTYGLLKKVKPINLCNLIRDLFEANSLSRRLSILTCLLELYDQMWTDWCDNKMVIFIKTVLDKWFTSSAAPDDELDDDDADSVTSFATACDYKLSSMVKKQHSEGVHEAGGTTWIGVVVGAVVVLVGAILSGCTSVKNTTGVAIQSAIDVASRNVKNLQNLHTTLPTVIKDLTDSTSRMCGVEVVDDKIGTLRRVDEVFQELRRFATDLDTKAPLILPHPNKIAKLRSEVARLRADLISTGGGRDPTIGKMMGDTLDLYNRIMNKLDHLTELLPFRQTPILIVLAGEPGCGKTELAKFLAKELTKDPDNPDGSWENMNLDIDHFDGYHNSKAVIIEDVGKADLPKDMVMLQNLVDSSIYYLNCDNIDMKKTQFTSEVIIVTTNQEDLYPNTLAQSAPLARRVTLHLAVVNPAHQKFKKDHHHDPQTASELASVFNKDFSHLRLFKLHQNSHVWKNRDYPELNPTGVLNYTRDILRVKIIEFETRLASCKVKLAPSLQLEAPNDPVILLEGAPGTGKSTMARMLMKKYRCLLIDDFAATPETYRKAFHLIKKCENQQESRTIILTTNPLMRKSTETQIDPDTVAALGRKIFKTYTFSFRSKGFLSTYTYQDVTNSPLAYDDMVRIESTNKVKTMVEVIDEISKLVPIPLQTLLSEVPYVQDVKPEYHLTSRKDLRDYAGLTVSEGLKEAAAVSTDMKWSTILPFMKMMITAAASDDLDLTDPGRLVCYINMKGLTIELNGVVQVNFKTSKFFLACKKGAPVFAFMQGDFTNIRRTDTGFELIKYEPVLLPGAADFLSKVDELPKFVISGVDGESGDEATPLSGLQMLLFVFTLTTGAYTAVSLLMPDAPPPPESKVLTICSAGEIEMRRTLTKEEYDKLVAIGVIKPKRNAEEYMARWVNPDDEEKEDNWAGNQQRERPGFYDEVINFETNPILNIIKKATVPIFKDDVRIAWGLRSGKYLILNTHVARVANSWGEDKTSFSASVEGSKRTLPQSDLAVMTMNRTIPLARDISGYFMTDSDNPGSGCQAFVLAEGATFVLPATVDVTRVTNLQGHTFKATHLNKTKVAAVSSPIRSSSQPGDCGSAVIAQVGLSYKIIGLHSGSSESKMYCCCLTEEVFGVLQMNKGGITQIGTTGNKDRVEMQTSIYRHPLYTMGKQPHKEPALLSPLDSRTTSPKTYSQLLKEQVNHFDVPDVPIDQGLLDECVEEISDWFYQTMRMKNYQVRPLSFSEALQNCDFSTGPGYEFVTKGVTSKLSMVTVCPEKGYKMNGKNSHIFIQMYNDLDKTTKTGSFRYDPTFSAALKDELLPLEKIYDVNKQKTRAIIASPFHVTVLGQVLSGSFYQFFSTHPGTTPVAVGVNPHSEVWTRMALNLQRAHKFVDFDFSRWDSTQPRCVMRACGDVVERVYERYGHDATQLRNYHLILENPRVIADNTIFKFNKGMISGRPGTSVLNSIAHMIYMLMFLKTHRSPSYACDTMVTEIPFYCYGDDLVLGVPDWFDQHTLSDLSQHYVDCGLKPTSANKTGQAKFTNFEDLTFIKRKFNWTGGRCWGALDEISLEQQMEFMRSKGKHDYYREPNVVAPCDDEALEASVYNVLLEAHHHGKELYDRIVADILEKVRVRSLVLTPMPTYRAMDAYLRGCVAVGSPMATNKAINFATPSEDSEAKFEVFDCVDSPPPKPDNMERVVMYLQSAYKDPECRLSFLGSVYEVHCWTKDLDAVGQGHTEEEAVEDFFQKWKVMEECVQDDAVRILNNLKVTFGIPITNSFVHSGSRWLCKLTSGMYVVEREASSKAAAKMLASRVMLTRLRAMVVSDEGKLEMKSPLIMDVDEQFACVGFVNPEEDAILEILGDEKPSTSSSGSTEETAISTGIEPTNGIAAAAGFTGSTNNVDPKIYEIYAGAPNGNFTISSNQTIGTTLWSAKITPDLNPFTAFYQRIYSAWAGGFDCQLLMAANSFTSGKLVAAFLPPGVDEGEIIGDEILCFPHSIIDVREAGEVMFQTGDVKNVLYHKVGDQSENGHGGTLTLRVLNTLRGASDVPYSIQARILTRPSADFGFSFLVSPTRTLSGNIDFKVPISQAFAGFQNTSVGGNVLRMQTRPAAEQTITNYKFGVCKTDGAYLWRGTLSGAFPSTVFGSVVNAVVTPTLQFNNSDGTIAAGAPDWMHDSWVYNGTFTVYRTSGAFVFTSKDNVTTALVNENVTLTWTTAPTANDLIYMNPIVPYATSGNGANIWTIPNSGESFLVFQSGVNGSYSRQTQNWNELARKGIWSSIGPNQCILCLIFDTIREVCVGLAKIYSSGVITTAATATGVEFNGCELRFLSIAPASVRPGTRTARELGYQDDIIHK